MTNSNTENDNWGQLLSDFGITDQAPEAAPPIVSDSSGADVSDSIAENNEDSSQPKEKKSMVSRFPKINFFGAPPEVSLDSVIEGTKSPSLGGKAFTDNKLEKMPVSQERTDRQKRNRRENEHCNESVDEFNAWSTVASQIDTLVDAKAKSEERPAKRVVSSMFDDPVLESEEARALKNLMGEQHSRKETRGRGARYQPPVEVDDILEADFVPVEEEMPKTRERGRRGSKYAGGNYRDREPMREETPSEEWSEIDAALQSGRNDLPAKRGGRRQRYDKRHDHDKQERPIINKPPLEGDDSGIVAVHSNVPSWDEAITDIISGNIVRHKGHSHSGRGRR